MKYICAIQHRFAPVSGREALRAIGYATELYAYVINNIFLTFILSYVNHAAHSSGPSLQPQPQHGRPSVLQLGPDDGVCVFMKYPISLRETLQASAVGYLNSRTMSANSSLTWIAVSTIANDIPDVVQGSEHTDDCNGGHSVRYLLPLSPNTRPYLCVSPTSSLSKLRCVQRGTQRSGVV